MLLTLSVRCAPVQLPQVTDALTRVTSSLRAIYGAAITVELAHRSADNLRPEDPRVRERWGPPWR